MRPWERAAEILIACRPGWFSAREVAEAVEMDEQNAMAWLKGLESRGVLAMRTSPDKPVKGIAPTQFTVTKAWGGQG